jgi:nucleoside-diphosphate-sugar epimerase
MEAVPAPYRGRTIAVTGASGYLAAALLRSLRDSGAHVLAVSRRVAPRRQDIEWLQGDVRTLECCAAVVARADVIFHLAGNTSASAADRDSSGSFESTVGPIDLFSAAARLAGRCPRLVFASTATVYGLTPQLPVSEYVRAQPLTIYDAHKLEAEQRLIAATANGALDGIVLRLANVYGLSPALAAAPDRGFLNRVVDRALSGFDIEVYGGGGYLRDFIHIDDVVRAFVAAGTNPAGPERCFNLASGTGAPLRQAVSIAVAHAERLTDCRVPIVDAPWPAGAHAIERRSFIANIDRIRTVMRWSPAISLDEGIGRLADHIAARSRCETT